MPATLFKKFAYIFCCLLIIGEAGFIPSSGPAQAMGFVRDLLSTSRPGVGADHTITFLASEAIPPGGRIELTPETNKFTVVPGFNYSDIDLATSSSPAGPYTDRAIAAAPTAVLDGAAVVIGMTLERIVITLNSSYGIAEGEYVKISFGTNATYGQLGNQQILNANYTGSYGLDIDAYDSTGKHLDHGKTMVVMVAPVTMNTFQGKLRSNGRPSGVLAYGTTQTIMSLNTNYIAACSFSTASGTLYADMTSTFAFTGAYFHSTLLGGLIDGGSYKYFIRCRDEFGVDDTTDYEIAFEVSMQPGEEGEESGVPGPGGGGSGGGGGGGFGQERGRGRGTLLPYPPLPDLPGVALAGWAFPLSEVVILRDGQEQGAVSANSLAEFGAFFEDLPQGVYTFGVWSTDSDGRRSVSFSTTFWIDEGTQSIVNDIVIPPTIALSQKTLAAGETVSISGQSAPGATVEVWFYPKNITNPKDGDAVKKTATADSNGRWSVSLAAGELDKGVYTVKAKSVLAGGQVSGFGLMLDLSVETEAVVSECAGADLNGDGRVNITDFSILLYWWETDNACADQNHDGTVNLTDFSIMMYYWTG